VTSSAVVVEARETTERVARTFAIAARLLPRTVRDDVYVLYLIFRTLDDLVDFGHPDARARIVAVQAWCDGLGGASSEVDLLDDLASRHPLPRHAMRSFCAGMWQDLEGPRMVTEADVDAYCYRVAGTVGVMMAAVLGTDGEPGSADEAAAALGMAMQRTNILRDIDEDREQGRVYLAAETLARHGDSLAPGRREAVVRDQIARADALYDRGLEGLGRLRTGRRAIAAAAAMYREILRQIEREGYGARAGRVVVAGRRKLAVAAPAYAMQRPCPRCRRSPNPSRAVAPVDGGPPSAH
jgi:phytoene synthase